MLKALYWVVLRVCVSVYVYFEVGDLVSKETVCCVGGKVKH